MRGSVPSETVVLASLLSRSDSVFQRGVKLADHEVLLVQPGETLDFRCIHGDEQFTVAIHAPLFEEFARAMLGPGFADRRFSDRLALRGTGNRDHLNRRLASLLDEGLARSDRLLHPDSSRDWEYRVLDAWLADVTPPDPRFAPAMRLRAAREAESFLRATLDRPVSIGELCLVTGVPKRTLMLGFTDSFGIPPLTFHRRLRLNAARRHLAGSRLGETTVTAVALRWGFDHFGRFSVDYRRMFGESPIATLRGLR